MSLDVTLHSVKPIKKTCPHCGSGYKEIEELFDANITHNLGTMAREVEIYHLLWRPEELNITMAEELITPLSKGLARLKADPERYKEFNPKNGWGTYERLIEFVEKYLQACIDHPEAIISISR